MSLNLENKCSNQNYLGPAFEDPPDYKEPNYDDLSNNTTHPEMNR